MSKHWQLTIDSSLLLQYKIELGRCDLIDGPKDGSTTRSRLDTLRTHRRAWRTLEPSHTDTFTRDTKNLYEASGSIFAWGTGESSRPFLCFYQAPSNIFDRPAPRMWELRDMEIPFRDFAMSEEEGLIVLIQEDDPEK